MNNKLIEVRKLTKTYEGDSECRALKDVSLSINRGDFVSIVGRSGSGKSTLLNCIAGLDIPQDGKVIIDEMSIYDLTEDQRSVFRREYVGLIFQQYHLIPILSAFENVLVAFSFSDKSERNDKAMELLDRVGLEGKANNIPSKLSGGESQRVAIARALANKPLIILADEPTGNLDHETGKKIMELLANLNNEGHTIVMVTHDMECARYGNKILTLDDGRVASVEHIKRDYRKRKEVSNGTNRKQKGKGSRNRKR